jgi:hypothetical protein
MEKRRSNWLLWLGFLTSVVAFVSYFLFFFQFPVTRDIPWVNYLLFAVAALFLAIGLRRAYARISLYRGKISGPILTVLSAAVLGVFCFTVLVESKHLPASTDAPHVGQKAPLFSLPDINGKPVSLSGLLATPIDAPAGSKRAARGVLLVFYRGYW